MCLHYDVWIYYLSASICFWVCSIVYYIMHMYYVTINCLLCAKVPDDYVLTLSAIARATSAQHNCLPLHLVLFYMMSMYMYFCTSHICYSTFMAYLHTLVLHINTQPRLGSHKTVWFVATYLIYIVASVFEFNESENSAYWLQCSNEINLTCMNTNRAVMCANG